LLAALPHALCIGAVVSEQFRSVLEQLRHILRGVLHEGMPHPLLQACDVDAVTDSVNEKTMPDPLGYGVRPSRYPGGGNDFAYLFMHRLFALRPKLLRGVLPGLDAMHVMHLIEKVEKGIRHGNFPPDVGQVRQQAGKDDHPLSKIDLFGCELERFREIATGVMQQAAKGAGLLILYLVGSFDKSLPLLGIEVKPRSIIIVKMCFHVCDTK